MLAIGQLVVMYCFFERIKVLKRPVVFFPQVKSNERMSLVEWVTCQFSDACHWSGNDVSV